MIRILSTALNAVLPIVLLSVIGYFLKRIGFLTKQFSQIGSKLVFKVCLSSTLFINVYNIRNFSEIPVDIVMYCLAIIVVLFLLGLATTLLVTRTPQKRGVITHAVFRSNFAIIGLSLASALGGDHAMQVASVVSVFAIPLYNVLGVISLSIFTGRAGQKKSFWVFIKEILTNPMILGAILGGLCVLIRILQTAILGDVKFSITKDLPFVYETVNMLKKMTTPLALLVLGAQFEFSAVKGLLKEILFGTVWRLIFAPLLGIGTAFLLSRYTGFISVGVDHYPALIALFGSPVAVSTAVIASEMGGDEQLATQLVVWTSLGSVFSIYTTVCIMMAFGLLSI